MAAASSSQDQSPPQGEQISDPSCASHDHIASTISNRRQVRLDLHQFRALSVASEGVHVQRNDSTELCKHFANSHGSRPPPTPPFEENYSSPLSREEDRPLSLSQHHWGANVDIALLATSSEQSESQNVRTSLPSHSRDSSSSNVASPHPWLLQDIRMATKPLERSAPVTSVKMISQILPSCNPDPRPLKTYETACEHFQSILPEPRFISIYHALALSEGQSISDLPRSPPATPNAFGADGYFDSQSIFYHFTQVPLYHEARNPYKNDVPPQRNMLAPEANLVVLERYIPPTTADEYQDFFSASSGKSPLVDRLAELHPDNGTLLLVYPTLQGADTFARRYIGPVLDPLLRQFVILHGLGSDAAERLGRLRALSAMQDKLNMTAKMSDLCHAMNTRSDVRKMGSSYSLIYDKVAEIELHPDTWMSWFIKQEHQRFKQDLIDYQLEGGVIPQGESRNSDITPETLVRKVIDELKGCKLSGMGPGLEVGVFVIRRSLSRVSES